MVPKAFKEVKQQVDIVGKGRGDHGDSSWKGFAVFSRRTCHYRLCQVIYAHPSNKCTWNDHVFDEGLDRLSLHIGKQIDHHLPTPLQHSKAGWPLFLQCASATFAFASASTSLSSLG